MIRVLEKNVADKIAAGEVVERPVSIVKELVENAIDAGAGKIAVEIRNGGKTFLRVTDDGCGIPAGECATAFQRHATSKIESVRDLDAVETLGFRGEALASIAAVTRVSLITKPADQRVGRRLTIHGGRIVEQTDTGCPDGTTMVVTDLFYNTPARREFLRSDSAEAGRVIGFMSEIAIAFPDVRFTVLSNGKMIFSTDGDGSMKNAVLAVYPIREYRNLVEVDTQEEGLRLRGCVSRATLSRTNRREQYFIVNGHVVNSPVLTNGAAEAYRRRLFPGRYPILFLHLTVDPSSLDVNIHPSKREVRFHDEKRVQQFLTDAVRSALDRIDGVPSAADSIRDRAPEEAPEIRRKADTSEQIDVKQLLKTKREEEERKAAGEASREREGAPEEMAGVREASFLETRNGSLMGADEDFRPGTAEIPTNLREEAVFDLKPEHPQGFSFDELELIGVLFDTYLLATDRTGFYLIDQHAAHERVNYERFVDGYLRSEKRTQEILPAFPVDVPRVLSEDRAWLPLLRAFGYEAEMFGPSLLRVTGIPQFMSIGEAEAFAKFFVQSYEEEGTVENTAVIDRIIMHACKSSVKANDVLSREEQEALVEELKKCRNPYSCPHGRPTFIRFSRRDIERLFRRTT